MTVLAELRARADDEGFVRQHRGGGPKLLTRLSRDLALHRMTMKAAIELLEGSQFVEVLRSSRYGDPFSFRVRLGSDVPAPPVPPLSTIADVVLGVLEDAPRVRVGNVAMAALPIADVARVVGRDPRVTWALIQRLERRGFLTIHRRRGVRPHRYELHLDRIRAARLKRKYDERT